MSAPTVAAGKAARSKKRRQKHSNGAAAPAAAARSSRWGWLARSGAAPAGKATRSKQRKKHSKGAATAAQVAVQPARWRWLAYNGGAAALGHSLLWGVSGDPMAGATVMADINLSLVPVATFTLTCTAAYAGWKAGGVLRGVLPGFAGLAVRPAAALGAAFWGQGSGPLITEFMAWSAPWSALLAPLAVAGAFGAVCWLYLERYATGWTAPLRWAARIPLATVILSSLLYAPGVLL